MDVMVTGPVRAMGAPQPVGVAVPKRLHLQILRVIAIFLVVFNHTGSTGFVLFAVTDNRFTYPVYLFVSILCKIAIPLFFMVSGALLIDRTEDIRTLYMKRVSRIVILLVAFSALMYIVNTLTDQGELSLGYFIKTAYSSSGINVAYWYLYAYLAMLMMLPLLRRMAKAMSDREYLYLAVLQILYVGVLPIAEYLFGFGRINIDLPLAASMGIFYPLMGHFLEHRLSPRFYRRTYAYGAVLVSFACIAISSVMTNYRMVQTGDVAEQAVQSFHLGLIAIPAFTVFYLARYFSDNIEVAAWARRFIIWFGEMTLGIYLLESVLRRLTRGVYTFLFPYIHSLPAACVWVASVLLAGAIITAVLKRVPVLGRLL